MKRRELFTSAGAAGLGAILFSGCEPKQPESEREFRFIFFNDLHVQPEKGASKAFDMAIEKINSLDADLVIGGGDLIMDALGVDEQRAFLLYDMYEEQSKQFAMPLHNVMGNHEVFGIYVPDKVDQNHPDWGKELFKRRLGNGNSYNSFDHKGVHFVLLDSVGIVPREDGSGAYRYIGEVGVEQLAWLEDDLASLEEGTPVVAASHIPLFTMTAQIENGPMAKTPEGTAITDGKPLYDLLTAHNLVTYLQGHIHINEYYEYHDAAFIDNGALSGGWWGGPYKGHPEGFRVIDVYKDGTMSSEYMAYGWDASKYNESS
jgi:3',5'-cyclic AMP phosphodiesterase CpdA